MFLSARHVTFCRQHADPGDIENEVRDVNVSSTRHRKHGPPCKSTATVWMDEDSVDGLQQATLNLPILLLLIIMIRTFYTQRKLETI